MYDFNNPADVQKCLTKLSTVQGQITKAKNETAKNLTEATQDLLTLKMM